MDWSRFQSNNEDPRKKFEAFSCSLFERWCRNNFGNTIPVNFVNGSGGDGGIEAYALLNNGNIIGFQAKWFNEKVGNSQFRQIKNSITTALKVRNNISQYIIAVPHDLTNIKLGKGGKTVKSEQMRWNELTDFFKSIYPNLKLAYWGDKKLEDLLATLCSEKIYNYWFGNPILSQLHFKKHFRKAKDSWLSYRYIPEVHCVGQIENDLKQRLLDYNFRKVKSDFLRKCISLLDHAINEILQLPKFPSFRKKLINPNELIDKQINEFINWKDAVSTTLINFETGTLSYDSVPMSLSNDVYRTLIVALEDEKGKPFEETKHIHDILRLVFKMIFWEFEMLNSSWINLAKPVLFIGEPGSGKTHALAHAVEMCLKNNLPAILIRAADVDPDHSWAQILSNHLDLPSWSEEQILDALEATATWANVISVVSTKNDDLNVFHEPIRVLIAIDGLDETTRFLQWERRLQEIQAVIGQRKRICVAISIRSRNFNFLDKDILNQNFDIHHLRQENDVSPHDLFPVYCEHFNVRYESNSLLRWYFESPMSVRLFCEEFKNQLVGDINRTELSLARLIARKLVRFEDEVKERIGKSWPISFSPSRPILRTISNNFAFADGKTDLSLSLSDAIANICKSNTVANTLSSQDVQLILESACDFGLLTMYQIPSKNPLDDDDILIAPANNILMEYLIADAVFNNFKNEISKGNVPQSPAFHHNYPNATLLLILRLFLDSPFPFYDSELFKDVLTDEYRAKIQANLLIFLPLERVNDFQDWVTKQIVSSMPSRRMVIHELVVPVSRIKNHPFGAMFIHKLLKEYSVADRDLFWSGPNYLPVNCGGVWEGHGTSKNWRDITLESDDPFWSAPLLLAWGTTTVDNDERDHIRCELAKWGASNLLELNELLNLTIDTNDPQMIEDLISSAYGSVCLAGTNPNIMSIAQWMYDQFFSPSAFNKTDNAIIRHCARGIIERALAIGLDIPLEMIKQIRNPAIDTDRLLPLDKESIKEKRTRNEYDPISWDLAWYVVPNSYKDFFNEVLHEKMERKENDIKLIDIDKNILECAIAGNLGYFSNRTLNNIRNALGEMKAIEFARGFNGNDFHIKIHQFCKTANDVKKITNDLERQEELFDKKLKELDSGFDWGILENQANFICNFIQEEKSRRASFRKSKKMMHQSALALLDQHAKKYFLDEIDPAQFGFGYVIARIRELGWNEKQFVGKPNGGEPGEKLGADIAILRKYHPSSHGSKSRVMQYIEKYVWIATHELIGYLADRLSIRSEEWHRKFIDPPYDLAHVIEEIPNPASRLLMGNDQHYQEDEKIIVDNDFFSERYAPCDLCPNTSVEATMQPDIAMEWVEKASVPDLSAWITPKRDSLPEWAREYDWLPLRTYSLMRNQESQAESILWLSCLMLVDGDINLILRDADAKVKYIFDRWSQVGASLGRNSYYDPIEVLWAPWATDNYKIIHHPTINKYGKPVNTKLWATWTQSAWLDNSEEKHFRIPAQWLRSYLNIIDYKDDRFLNHQGEVVAFNLEDKNHDTWLSKQENLFIRHDLLEGAIKKNNGKLIWGVRLLREPANSLFSWHDRKENQYIDRDIEYIATFHNKRLKIIQYSDLIEKR